MKIDALSVIISHLEAFEKMTKTKLEITDRQRERLINNNVLGNTLTVGEQTLNL